MSDEEDIDLSAIDEALAGGCGGLFGRDLLRLLDLTPAEFTLVLDTAAAQKAAWAAGKRDQPCTGDTVAVILEKPSLRTRSSFEAGISRLGAHPLVMSDQNSAFSRGESVQDTTLVLERFVDAIVLRTFAQSKIEEVAEWASVPVINALTDEFHPCQGLADALTIREHKGDLAGLKLAYVGDGNNMAHTYLELGALAGMEVRIATPPDFAPLEWVVDDCREAAADTGAAIDVGCDPVAAVDGADVVVTDTWTSMGEEEEHDTRLKAFEGFQVNAALMAHAADDAIFMHCLPAHRGEEVTDEVVDADCSVIYDEAENRLHTQKALLSLVLGAA
ncbi:MAG: ornithine carbamoyltransferase [Coriobacteriaceae bacterium]|nr:ornithine carbamoyltransferase [Coriobacteriaceae bacterium]